MSRIYNSLGSWNLDEVKNGIIFEFKTMKAAIAFAEAVEQRFKLDSRVFDNVEDAYRSHLYPFVQTPPVVHVDRPWWEVDPHNKKAWDEAWKLELQIEKLAVKLGGEWIGT